MVSALWKYRKANPEARERLHVVVFEEVHWFVPETHTQWDRGSRTLLEQCFTEGRAYGFEFLVDTYLPAKLETGDWI